MNTFLGYYMLLSREIKKLENTDLLKDPVYNSKILKIINPPPSTPHSLAECIGRYKYAHTDTQRLITF